jgi:hypothetical protein
MTTMLAQPILVMQTWDANTLQLFSTTAILVFMFAAM